MLTVFTPAYNKASTLERLYRSLLYQTDVDFEWIVINDGSEDETDELMQTFIAEGKLPIRYKVIKNGGKQRAYNQAVLMAKGEYFVCIDGDDYFLKDALKIIQKEADEIMDEPQIAGVRFPRVSAWNKR